MEGNTSYEKELAFQADRRKATTEFIKLTSNLWYDKSVEIVLFKNQIIDRNVSDIIQLHEYAGEFVQKPISIFDSVELLRAIGELQLPPSKVDIGKLTYEYHTDDNHFEDVKVFVADKLKDAMALKEVSPKDVVLYGFGRFGRLLARELMAKLGKGTQLSLKAIVSSKPINVRTLEKWAASLRSDSIQGKFMGTIEIDYDQRTLIINGAPIPIISAESPENLNYRSYGISNALVVDSSKTNTSKKELQRHLKNEEITQVLLATPGEAVPNIVHGVNHLQYRPENTQIFSAASCPINAVAPILKAVDDSLGIIQGHMETLLPYSNGQVGADNLDEKYRLESTSRPSMAIDQTHLCQIAAKVLPTLKGKLTSNSIKVPSPTGSLAILNLELEHKTSLNGINTIIKKYALEGDLVEQIKYSINKEMVSTDIIGSSAPSIYDSKATIVSNNGRNIVLYIWFNNEYGYVNQIIRLAEYMTKVRRYSYD